MMENVYQYLLSVLATAILVAIVNNLSDKLKSGKAIKLASALVMAIVVLSPLRNFQLTSYLSRFETMNDAANGYVNDGKTLYDNYLVAIINERCEAYILDKADELGVKLTVHIACDTSDLPVPVYAEISGEVSPYAREKIQHIISSDIGIPEEQQLWI